MGRNYRRRGRAGSCVVLRQAVCEMLEERRLLSVTILSEDFEGNFPSDNGWAVADANSSGIAAYWGAVDSAFGGEGTQSGSKKGYCAGVGFAGTTTMKSFARSKILRTVWDSARSAKTSSTGHFFSAAPYPAGTRTVNRYGRWSTVSPSGAVTFRDFSHGPGAM